MHVIDYSITNQYKSHTSKIKCSQLSKKEMFKLSARINGNAKSEKVFVIVNANILIDWT